jgi:DNA polymerase III epsilon subunit-like protein
MSQKRKFQMSSCAQTRKCVEIIPKAKDIVEGGGWCKPPSKVLEQIQNESTWFIGVDIETHDWETTRGNKGHIGKFGFYNLCKPIDLEARIVQLGWSFGPPGEDATIKEFMVYPEGFKVSEKATKYHGISNDQATEKGKHLEEVLSEFMDDARYVIDENHGTLVCHHMEFDAGIIANEMHRCGLLESMKEFENYAFHGLCTMNPAIGRWLMQCHGQDVGPSTSMNVLSLKKIVEFTLPNDKHLLEKHHSAGVDSLLVRKLAYALCRLSKKDMFETQVKQIKET